MDTRKIKNLIDILDKTSVVEIVIREQDSSVHIKLDHGHPPSVQMHTASPPPPQPVEPAPIAHVAPTPPEEKGTPKNAFLSPMVGTFYASPSPDSAPFISVGSTVKPGQTLCIIEAMKILNRIESDRSGVVKEILITNGQPVEFDLPLFVIE